ncbi:MAG: sulfatase-like hydrolase/transferase [Gammaproteobacteria bacterium]|nr:sulfatase-like hydrolase/transferase [Gammaproteobacteria bacterium]
MITRFTFAVLHILFAASAFSASPNILIIYVDDLGYGDTAVYGHPIVETPNIDRLAKEGVRFTQFYAPSALCSPSRAGLLTGRTPYRTGVKSWIPDNSDVALARDEFTIAQLVEPLGYRTAVIGKWHLNGGLHLEDMPQPRDFGFDYQYGLAAWVKNEKAAKAKSGKLYPDNMYRNNEPVGQTNKFSAELITDEAIDWLSSVHDEPFFLLLTYSEVHTPVASPEKYLDQYDQFLTAESRGEPLRYYMDWADRPSRGKGEYYANISYMDAQMGRVLELLRQSGRLDDTLVIFSSDNGPVTSDPQEAWELNMAGETGGFRGRKRYLFEGGLRVPGIFRWPDRLASGVSVDTPVTALDILPTIADYLELVLPEGRAIDGQSIAGLLDEDETTSLERSSILYWSIPTPDGMEYAVRQGPWKMILDPKGLPQYLFNLSSDRYEVNNLLQDEADRAKQLKEKFDIYRASVEG